jgi:hypothetical protein
VTPFAFAEQLFLNVEQVIPTPEANELMIGIRAKEAEEKITEAKCKTGINYALSFGK